MELPNVCRCSEYVLPFQSNGYRTKARLSLEMGIGRTEKWGPNTQLIKQTMKLFKIHFQYLKH